MTYVECYAITGEVNQSNNNNNIETMMTTELDNPERGLGGFPEDDVLGNFFSALANDNIQALRSIHIPRSDVFYVREKYYQDTGHWVSLDRMERAMFLEGHLRAYDVKDPNRKRDWEE